MPTLAIHLSITIFLILIFLGENLSLKKALILILFGLISDLDNHFLHRATLHNIFFPIGIILATKVLIKYKLLKKELLYLSYIAASLISAHILLDAMDNGVFLLYPFIDKSYHFGLWFGTTEHGLVMEFDEVVKGTTDTITYVTTPSKTVPRIPIISNGIQLGILLLSILALSFKYIAIKLKNKGTYI